MSSWANDKMFLKEISFNISGQEMEQVKERADAACANQFIFTHPWDMERCDVPVTFLEKIDWTYCYKGDPEWAFMLNRQRFMAEIGQMYVVSGDESYVHHWKRIFYEWIEANKDAAVHQYTYRKLDTGIRLSNWLKGYECISSSEHWTAEDDTRFKEETYKQGAFLFTSFTPFDFQSNWGFLETNGLVQAAYFMDEMTKDHWMHTALPRLKKMINLQIDQDGLQKEQSPMYDHEVLHSVLEIILVLRRNGEVVLNFIEDAANHMLTGYYQMMKPNGHQPMLGDSDDTNIQSTLAIGAVMFDRTDLRALAGDHCPLDVIWYFGREGLQKFNEMDQRLPETISTHLPDSGMTVFRTGWGAEDHYLLFDHGSMGQVNKGHGHDDTLHIELMSGGREFLIDGGRYTYCEGQERAYFKRAHRHNTITVDDYPASVYSGTWSWDVAAEPIDQKAHFTADYQFAQSGHTGFWRLPDPVHVSRKIVHVPDLYDLIIDCFTSDGKHDYTQHFHFPEDTLLQQREDHLVTNFSDGHNAALIPFIDPDVVTVKEGETSRHYNEKTTSPHAEIIYKQKETLAAPFIIMPFVGENPNISIQALPVYHINGKQKSHSEVIAYEINISNKRNIIIYSLSGNDSFLVDNYQVCGELIFIEDEHIHVIL